MSLIGPPAVAASLALASDLARLRRAWGHCSIFRAEYGARALKAKEFKMKMAGIPTVPARTTIDVADEGRFIDLPCELEEALIERAHTLPAWTMEGTFLVSSTIGRYRARLASAPLFDETISSLLHILSGAADGYAVVRLGNIADALGTGNQFLRVATAILAELAVPFQPFRRWPLWKEIGTNLDANPGLSTGTGYNAFHMDLVNATRPPDYATLLGPTRSAAVQASFLTLAQPYRA
jgi:hypothetical protein